jgi:hypothetical protein
MSQMNNKQAYLYLTKMWENGLVPSNFTESHSEWSTAILHLKKFGYVLWDEINL